MFNHEEMIKHFVDLNKDQIYGFISDEDWVYYPLINNEKYFIMTESGKTFSNIKE